MNGILEILTYSRSFPGKIQSAVVTRGKGGSAPLGERIWQWGGKRVLWALSQTYTFLIGLLCRDLQDLASHLPFAPCSANSRADRTWLQPHRWPLSSPQNTLVCLVSGIFAFCVLGLKCSSFIFSDGWTPRLFDSTSSLISLEKASRRITQFCLDFSYLAKYPVVILYSVALFYVLMPFIRIWSYVFYLFRGLLLVSSCISWISWLRDFSFVWRRAGS